MSGNSAFVVMMQTTDFLNFDDLTFVESLYLSALASNGRKNSMT